MYDLVIRNGTVVDGSGLGSYRADVGVVGGRIAFVGRIREQRRARRSTPRATSSRPASSTATPTWTPRSSGTRSGTNSCWHGVTTVVMGNCGFTLAPARPDERALVVRNLERAEDIDPGGAGRRHRLELGDVPRVPRRRRPAARRASTTRPTSATRRCARGRWASGPSRSEADRRRPRRAWSAQLRDALRAGAIGFTTSRSEHHETSDDRPVASRLAAWDEVRRLVGVMGDLGAGVFEVGRGRACRADDPSVRERVARPHARPGRRHRRADHLRHRRHRPGRLAACSTSSTRPPRAGGRMFGQTHCRGISVLLSFKTQLPFDLLPEWQPVRALPLEEQTRALRDPDVRAAARRRGRRTATTAAARIGAEARKPDFEGIRVYDTGLPPNPTVADVGRPARRASGRGDDRPRARDRLRAALHPAEPVPAGSRRDCCR